MRLFAKLAQVGSFTAAGKALGVPKQTVSRRISELEATLGVQLVQRTTRTLRLTQIGMTEVGIRQLGAGDHDHTAFRCQHAYEPCFRGGAQS